MVDTIKLAWLLGTMPLSDRLERSDWLAHFGGFSRELKNWSYKEKKGSKYPRLTLFRAANSVVYLALKVSLPAFVHGSNARLLLESEALNALLQLCRYASDLIGQECALAEAKVWEVHFAKDTHFGEENIARIVRDLASMNIKGLERGRYREHSLYFHSKGRGNEAKKPRVLCIYPKMADCIAKKFPAAEIKAADGNIRLEFRYRTTPAVKTLVKNYALPDRSPLNILRQEVCDKVLSPIENHISRLLEESARGNPVATLKKRYGNRRASTLIMFLVHLHYYGEDFYKIPILGYPRSSYYACQKQCREAGIYRLFENPDTKIRIGDVL